MVEKGKVLKGSPF